MNEVTTTALALAEILAEGPILAGDLRVELELRGGTPDVLHEAAKWLRDRGIPVTTTKRRHLSEWDIAHTGAAMDVYLDRVLREAYSEAVSVARSAAYLRGPNARVVRNRAVVSAVSIGERLNIDAEIVIAECVPLPGTPGS